MALITTYVYITLIAISISYLLNKSFAITASLTFIIISLSIIVGGYLGDLRIGVFASLMWIFIAITKLIKTKKILISIKEWLETNYLVLLIYTLFFVYLTMYHRVSSFDIWDEWSHWGPMIKGMFKYNRLYPYLSINNAHPDYPPLFQCVEYLFCYLHGGYSEPSLYTALSIFCFSLFLPVLDINKIEKKRKQILICVVFVTAVLLNITISYNSLSTYLEAVYLDFPYSVLAATTIYLIISFSYDDKFDYIITSAFLSALLLSKELGIAFFFMALFILFFNKFIKNSWNDNIKNVLFFILVPVIFFISWKIYTRGIVGQFDLSKINIKDVYNILINGKGEEWKLLVRSKYIEALYSLPILSEPFNLSYLSCGILTSLIFIPSIIVSSRDRKIKIIIILSWIIAIIGFAFTMAVLYISGCFSEGEAVVLASYQRYMGSCVSFQFVLTTFIVIDAVINNYKFSKIILCVFIVILLACNSKPRSKQLVSNAHTTNYLDNYEFNEFKRSIESNCPLGSKILVIDKDVYKGHLYNYYYNNKEYSFGSHITYDSYPGDVFIDLYYNNYDYVYILSYNEGLKEAWSRTSNDPLNDLQLYKVEGTVLRMAEN